MRILQSIGALKGDPIYENENGNTDYLFADQYRDAGKLAAAGSMGGA
jgi:hypothetical protein